ncbi:MAG: cytidylate kinase-like family protein [Ignavibacteria bacterium]|jgi:cytidylate kinase
MGIITISRGSYSRGTKIAAKLAEKLGYECISREILLEASKDFNVPQVKLTHAIEDAPSFLDRFKHGKKKYVTFIKKSFLEHIQRDNVLYHGLAGHYFTQGLPNVLKIRIHANLEYRINVIMKRENVPAVQAAQMIQKIDAERSRWSTYLYGIDTESPELYDIILRIDCIGVDEAVEALCEIATRPCFQSTPESMSNIKDMFLAESAYSAIINNFPEANVKCRDGIVMVSLESSLSAEEKVSKKIQKLVKNIDGIKEVRTFVIPFDV